MTISIATESNATETNTATPAAPTRAVEDALAAAITDAGRIGDLLDVLRTARLWLPLPADSAHAISGTAVTLPIVSYLGSDFVPAYSSADLLRRFAGPAEGAAPPEAAVLPRITGLAETGRLAQTTGLAETGGQSDGTTAAVVPHVVVRAADLARLLPPSIGIALNAGATESVPVYPQGVSYLAADDGGSLERITVGPLPVRPDGLLAGIAAGLIGIAAVKDASAAWLSVQFAGEGLLVSVTLDDPFDDRAQDLVVGVIERATWEAAPSDAGFAIDVTFPGDGEPDRIDECVAAFASPFYRRDIA